MGRQRLQVAGLGRGLGGDRAAPPGGAVRQGAGAGLVDGDAHVGGGDFQPRGDALGQRLHRLLGAATGLGVAVQGDAAAWRLDQHVEGVLDQRRMAPARAGDSAHGLVGKRQELGGPAAQALAIASWPARLVRPAEAIRTRAMRPSRLAGPSQCTGCRYGLRPTTWPG